jgi:ABC-2 type transport system permease protein
MNLIRDTLSIAWKDLQIIFKDRGALIILFFLPLLIGSMYGSIYQNMGVQGEQGISFAISLTNLDDGPYGKQVASLLEQVDILEIQKESSVAGAETLIEDGKVLAAVVIPASFSHNVNDYLPSTIEVIVDPVQAQYGSIVTGIMKEVITPVVVQGEVQYGIRTLLDESGLLEDADPSLRQAVEAQNLGVVMTQVQEMIGNPLISVISQGVEGAQVGVPDNWFALFLPAFAVMFAFFVITGVAPELHKEKQEGTLRRLLSAPISRSAILAGKMLAYLVIVILQVLVIFGVGNIVFGMPLGKAPLGMILITLAMGLAATSLGAMLASVSRSERQANSVGMVLGFLLAGLGGCIQIGLVPIYRMGGALGTISKFIPHAHALEAFRKIMLEGAGTLTILPQLGILLGFTALFLAIAVWQFRFE